MPVRLLAIPFCSCTQPYFLNCAKKSCGGQQAPPAKVCFDAAMTPFPFHPRQLCSCFVCTSHAFLHVSLRNCANHACCTLNALSTGIALLHHTTLSTILVHAKLIRAGECTTTIGMMVTIIVIRVCIIVTTVFTDIMTVIITES